MNEAAAIDDDDETGASGIGGVVCSDVEFDDSENKVDGTGTAVPSLLLLVWSGFGSLIPAIQLPTGFMLLKEKRANSPPLANYNGLFFLKGLDSSSCG